MDVTDCIVVGSGCSGAMAAQTLAEAGKTVAIVDAGITDPGDHERIIPDSDFLSLRKSDGEQHRYLLGEAQDISVKAVGTGGQITPPRRYMVAQTDRYLPVQSATFSPLESLAYGGLGVGWGLGCQEFSDAELRAANLDAEVMRSSYDTVAGRIGISATEDDAAAYTIGGLSNYQPSVRIDRNGKRITRAYQSHKAWFQKRGFVMGRSPLALLTRDMPGRKAYRYRDLDFYSDKDKSAWRPWITVDALRERGNVTYLGNQLALRFVENEDHVILHCLDIVTNQERVLRCRRLILATGALGSARIVLRSLGDRDSRLPLLANPYSYVVCLQPAMVGKGAEEGKFGLGQFLLFLDERGDNMGAGMAAIYTYQSMMLFRIVREPPLSFADSRILLQYLQSGLVIMGINQPDRPGAGKFLQLIPDASHPTGDALRIEYILEASAESERRRRERAFVRAGRKLGFHAIRRINPGAGSSIHYAGTVPFDSSGKPLTQHASGRLSGTRDVFVADSSGFTFLPAKGLTFTIMANAHRVALEALRA